MNIIEITSSGGLPQELMRVFKDLKFVEQLSSGVQRILSEYEKSIFKCSAHFLKVRFPITDVGKNYIFEGYKLNKTQKEILTHIKNTPQIAQK